MCLLQALVSALGTNDTSGSAADAVPSDGYLAQSSGHRSGRWITGRRTGDMYTRLKCLECGWQYWSVLQCLGAGAEPERIGTGVRSVAAALRFRYDSASHPVRFGFQPDGG